MKFLIEIHHPAHVHFFRNIVPLLLSRGHAVLLATRDRPPMLEMVESLYPSQTESFQAVCLSKIRSNNRFPLGEMLERHLGLIRLLRTFRPHLVASLMGVYAQPTSFFRIPNVVFTDSEFQTLAHIIAHPFASVVVTPRCYRLKEGAKHRRYAGYHELAYLHPRRFRPNPEVLEEFNIPLDRPFFFLRFSEWNTFHDVGLRAISPRERRFLLSYLAARGTVRASFEGPIPEEFQKIAWRGPAIQLHDLLYYADLVLSEGATTASEAAVLGTPTFYINPTYRGYLEEQQSLYGLVSNHTHFQDAWPALRDFLDSLVKNRDAVKKEYAERRKEMLRHSIDLSEWAANLLERIGSANR